MTTRSWQGLALFALVLFLIYGTRAVLLPFIAGFAVAYLLDPLADRLVAWRLPRWLATVVVLAAFFMGATGVLFALAPILQAQVLGVVENIPRYLAALRPVIDNFITEMGENLGADFQTDAREVVASIAGKSIGQLGDALTGLFAQGVALFNLLTLLIITPVVSFFLLRDWDLIVAEIDSLLPAEQADTIRSLAGKIDNALAGFVRGQTTVAVIMAVLYAAGWSFVGLDYALILGLLAGILAYVPFVGALFAALIAMLVGFGQFGLDGGQLGQVFAVFVVVQIIEGAVLTPRLIGGHVGLHPVWVLFAIFAGGELMGFVGVLIALPVAAAVGVLVRYGIEQYRSSDLHGGSKAKTAASTDPESKVKTGK